MSIARRLVNTFGGAGLDETVQLFAQWEPAETRDEDAELARAAKKQALGVPQAKIWAELGYSQEEIAQWRADAERRRQEEMQAQQNTLAAMNGRAAQ